MHSHTSSHRLLLMEKHSDWLLVYPISVWDDWQVQQRAGGPTHPDPGQPQGGDRVWVCVKLSRLRCQEADPLHCINADQRDVLYILKWERFEEAPYLPGPRLVLAVSPTPMVCLATPMVTLLVPASIWVRAIDVCLFWLWIVLAKFLTPLLNHSGSSWTWFKLVGLSITFYVGGWNLCHAFILMSCTEKLTFLQGWGQFTLQFRQLRNWKIELTF